MNIKYKKNNYIKFNAILPGEFFIIDGMLYLKIAPSDEKLNAFNCEKHLLRHITCDTTVRPINILLQEV